MSNDRCNSAKNVEQTFIGIPYSAFFDDLEYKKNIF